MTFSTRVWLYTGQILLLNLAHKFSLVSPTIISFITSVQTKQACHWQIPLPYSKMANCHQTVTKQNLSLVSKFSSDRSSFSISEILQTKKNLFLFASTFLWQKGGGGLPGYVWFQVFGKGSG